VRIATCSALLECPSRPGLPTRIRSSRLSCDSTGRACQRPSSSFDDSARSDLTAPSAPGTPRPPRAAPPPLAGLSPPVVHRRSARHDVLVRPATRRSSGRGGRHGLSARLTNATGSFLRIASASSGQATTGVFTHPLSERRVTRLGPDGYGPFRGPAPVAPPVSAAAVNNRRRDRVRRRPPPAARVQAR
jgi:hypothetical protein